MGSIKRPTTVRNPVSFFKINRVKWSHPGTKAVIAYVNIPIIARSSKITSSPEIGRYRSPARPAAILAADVVGYSRLIEADEEGTRIRLRSLHAELIEPRIAADGGRIVKTTGDGILVELARSALARSTADRSGRAA